jgi:hypothetical protein
MKILFIYSMGDKRQTKSFFEKIKIEKLRKNVEMFTEILGFIKKHENCIIFLSVDDYQFKKLRKLLSLVDGKNTEIKKESQLKKGTPEYQVSLVIDNLLNIERRKQRENRIKYSSNLLAA